MGGGGGGGGGGPKGMLAPLSNYWGGLASLSPLLPTPMGSAVRHENVSKSKRKLTGLNDWPLIVHKNYFNLFLGHGAN